MRDKEVSIEDLEAINHFSKISNSAQMFIGNFKKGNCDYFNGTLCEGWSWGDYKFSGLNSHFVLEEPTKRGDRLFINPHPFFCAICPKWRCSKSLKHTSE
jgi:hypothetical protein